MDKVIFNTRERPISDDQNNVELIQSRMLADFFMWISATHYEHGMGSSGVDSVPASATQGLSWRGGSNTITVQPGMLMQYSLSYPAAPAPLESAMRVGYLRTATPFTFPSTANTFFLMEIRVAEATTSTESRDVLDPGTGNFVPTLVTKRTETQIEAQFTAGTPTTFPGFTGGSWVPLCVFLTDGSGLFSNTIQTDLRPDLRELLGDSAGRETFSGDHPEAVFTAQALHTTKPGGTEANAIGGNVLGRLGREKFWLRCRDQLVVSADGAGGASGNQLEHFYLAPLSKNGIIVTPVVSDPSGTFQPATSSIRGILYRSNVAPNSSGRSNSNPLTQPAAFVNFDAVPTGKALHIGSARRNAGNTGYVKFSQTAAGRCHRGRFSSHLAVMGNVISAPVTYTIDLRTSLTTSGVDIPRNARAVCCNVLIISSDGTLKYDLVARLGTAPGESILTGTLDSDALAHPAYLDTMVDLPTGYEMSGGPDEGFRWEMRVDTVADTPSISIFVNSVAWLF